MKQYGKFRFARCNDEHKLSVSADHGIKVISFKTESRNRTQSKFIHWRHRAEKRNKIIGCGEKGGLGVGRKVMGGGGKLEERKTRKKCAKVTENESKH